jgi:hypothetical protein
MSAGILTVAQRLQREAIDRYGEAVNAHTTTAPQALGMVRAGEALVNDVRHAMRIEIRDALLAAGVL